MKKRISLIVLTSLFFIFSAVDYGLSFGTYNDGGYRGFYSSTDDLFIMITAAILVVLSVFILIGYLKNRSYQKEIRYTLLAVTVFHSCYSLFTMIKIIAKAVGALWDGDPFELAYSDISSYLVWFCLSAALLGYLIFDYFEQKKKSA